MGKVSVGKKLVKTIVLAAVAGILAIILIASNLILNHYAPLLHSFFAGADSGFGDEAQNVLNSSDEVVREIAEESMVLLKNDEIDGEPFLPRPKSEKFNLFGWASTDYGFLLVGGGSGGTSITAANPMRVTLTEAFDLAQVRYNVDLIDKYNAFSKKDADGGVINRDPSHYNMENPAASWYTDDLMQQAKDYSSTAIVTLSRWGIENGGTGELVNSGPYTNGKLLELTDNEKAIFDKLRAYNFKVIVLLNTTNSIEMQFIDDYDDIIEACLYVGIPGQSGASAIPKILTGEVNPSGRLSDTLAYDWQTHNPSYVNALSNSNGPSLAYAEGIYIGYKWYETADVAGYYRAQGVTYQDVVKYPFGYGLSYTTFKQEIVSKSWNDGEALEVDKEYTVTVRVTNTGDVAGRDVVQLYYTAPYIEGGIEKASINLLTFDKTAELKPYWESPSDSWQEITLKFTPYEMASYDDYDKNGNKFTGYELDKGNYYIKLMSNAHYAIDDTSYLTCNATISIDKDPVTGESVINRFTGNTAYANMPIDGSTGVTGGVTYLSRANAFANFSELKKVGAVTQAAKTAANFEPTVEPKGNISYGSSNTSYYLITNSDGTKASLDVLSGDKEGDLVVNEELLTKLHDWDSELWEGILNQLTQDNIKDLLGKGGFQTVAIEEIGKRRNMDSDGPAGFNSNVVNQGSSSEWTVFPAETLSGCSWSARLMYNLGRAQGAIGAATGRQGWYAPGVNLHRSVYNSRNYEYYSEDGVLSGKLAAQTVKGAKENNLYCYVKHFVISDNGDNAKDWYEWLTEQSLRENYLKAFEIVVKEGGANAMMSAFNKLGAVWCGYNQALLTDVLRTEWGFHGSVITDWYTGYMNNYNRAVKAGNDLWLNAESKSPANINFSNAQNAYAARQSAKGILYTYVDTYMAAKQHQELVDSGEYEDPFNVQLGVGIINAEDHSSLFVALWVILDAVLVVGIAACVLFIFLPKKKQSAEQPA
ncbi:MAG: glycoside hydrolase family 3 C-terminal domain-containing protein [Clostridiales bacterium]|nr:glycoside hydrolase family 3 C-terminal domain-containing protein [Clostridiales bacterium]